MEKLNNDELFSIALYLNLPDLLNFCSINSKMYNKLCKNNYLWLKLLNRDFKDRQQLNNNYKDLYILLWNLTDLKKQLNLKEDIYTLYSLKLLDLSNKGLTKIPSSIRFLSNLVYLNIWYNKLTELPDYLPNSLQKMNLFGNQLKEFPNSLPNSLYELDIEHNQLKKLPDNMFSLKYLYTKNNQLEREEIKRIKKLYPKLLIYY